MILSTGYLALGSFGTPEQWQGRTPIGPAHQVIATAPVDSLMSRGRVAAHSASYASALVEA